MYNSKIASTFHLTKLVKTFTLPHLPSFVYSCKTIFLHGCQRRYLSIARLFLMWMNYLTEEQKFIRETVRNYVKKEISPIIEDYAQRAEFPQQIVKQLGELGCFGPTIPREYGGGGLDYISYGLMMQELERGDSGVRSTASCAGFSLVMFPIYAYGSEEQRKKYLPKLATGEWLGCFGLTEPDHGSDPSGMLTNIKDAGDHVILNGSKMWISNAPFAACCCCVGER